MKGLGRAWLHGWSLGEAGGAVLGAMFGSRAASVSDRGVLAPGCTEWPSSRRPEIAQREAPSGDWASPDAAVLTLRRQSLRIPSEVDVDMAVGDLGELVGPFACSLWVLNGRLECSGCFGQGQVAQGGYPVAV